jgi:hypothetical protein
MGSQTYGRVIGHTYMTCVEILLESVYSQDTQA